ncbi:hypothetical protein LTR85_005919 [Meristemomyces frigidus]|nr:hypothetical protein LTR85_005919 [Meristemomyces frigidus]
MPTFNIISCSVYHSDFDSRVGFRTYEQCIKAIGVQSMYRRLRPATHEYRRHDDDESWKERPYWKANRYERGTDMLLRAIATTGFPVKRLKLRGIGVQSSRSRAIAHEGSWQQHSLDASWQHLTVLGLYCIPIADVNIVSTWGFDLARLLSEVVALERLEFEQDKVWWNEDYQHLLRFLCTHLSTTRLRSLKLKNLRAPQRGLVDLLTKFAPTLQDLTVENAEENDGGSWALVLAAIQQKLQLEHLQLSRLYVDERSLGFYYTNGDGAYDFDFQGRSSVEEGLLALRENGRYELIPEDV